MARQLYLLGGSAAFDVTADAFVPAAGGRDARIALLLQGGRHWQKYVPGYVHPWIARGVAHSAVIAPAENGELDYAAACATLADATGIFVGGGNTALYRQLYASEPMRALIRERYAAGIPYAGCSAGALIAPELCAFHPGESQADAHVAVGLGLIAGVLVGVHFSSEHSLPNLLAAMTETRTSHAWGIDDAACVCLADEQCVRVLSRAAYQITMTDFERRTYNILKQESDL